MTTEETLLAALRADPDNPAVWSIYADWLQSRGDPDGELIALQLEHDRCTDRGRRLDLYMRARDLRRPDTSGIDARLTVRDPAVLPGLAEHVRRKLYRVLLLWLSELAPEELAWLLAALADMPLRMLHASPMDVGPLAAILAACPRLARVGVIGGDASHAAVVARCMPDLKEFTSGSSSTIGDAGLEALAAIPSLRILEIPNAGVGAAGIAAVIAGAPLETLVASGNPIGDAGVAAICTARALRELEIEATQITTASLIEIAGSPGLASLRRLRLGGYVRRSGFTPSDLEILIASPHLSRELTLEIDGHALGLESEYRERDYAPEFDGMSWCSEPTGPIAERFRLAVVGSP